MATYVPPYRRIRQQPRSTGPLLQAHGDSFVGPLKQLSDKLVTVHRYSGATAKGLANEQSDKRVGQRLVACLDDTRPEKVLLQFGNVDINISSVYRLETKGPDGWDEKKFVADIWDPYESFLRNHVLPKLMASCPAENQYIRDLYFCTVTLPVVGDESLPESHAKYQYTKGKKGKEASPQEAKDMEIEGLKRIERVKPLVPYCCLDVRRRMTNDFNERLQSFVLDPSNAISGTSAQLHVVDLNQYIRQQVDSDEVDSQYVTDDPTNLHIIWENTLPFWIRELSSAGFHSSHLPTDRELKDTLAEYTARKEEQMKTMSQLRQVE